MKTEPGPVDALVERVARAIRSRLNLGSQIAEDLARVALEAMPEPPAPSATDRALNELVERVHDFGTFAIDCENMEDRILAWDTSVVPALVSARSALSAAPAPEAVAWMVDIPSFGKAFFHTEAEAKEQADEADSVGSVISPLYAHPPTAEALTERAVKAEREACAEIARQVRSTWLNGDATTAVGRAFQKACDQALDAIRGRARSVGEEKGQA